MRILVLVCLVLGVIGVSAWKTWGFWSKFLVHDKRAGKSDSVSVASSSSAVRPRRRVRVVKAALTGYCVFGMTQFEGREWVSTRDDGLFERGELSSLGMVKGVRRPDPFHPYVIAQVEGFDGEAIYVVAWSRSEEQGSEGGDRDSGDEGRPRRRVSAHRRESQVGDGDPSPSS